MNLGRAIKFYRTGRNISQTELADRAGISVAYMSLLERNKRDPTFSTIEHIALALDVSIVLLIFMAEDNIDTVLGQELSEKMAYASLRESTHD